VRDVLTASARERQDAKVQRVTVELTVEEERRQFEADVLERASEAISEVGDRNIPQTPTSVCSHAVFIAVHHVFSCNFETVHLTSAAIRGIRVLLLLLLSWT
jgi:hypothetical protein